MSTNVGLVVARQDFLKDHIFDEGPWDTSGGLMRWRRLRGYLASRGIELRTMDAFGSLREPDALLLFDPSYHVVSQLAKSLVDPRRVIAMLTEPRIIRPGMWRLLRLYSPFVKRVFVTDRSRAARVKIRWLPLPQPFDGHDLSEAGKYRAIHKDGFMVMLRGNKFSNCRGELYTERRRVVQLFDKQPKGLFDLYGPGWNDSNQSVPVYTKNYRGYAPFTVPTFARYKFVLTIDNSAVPGLLTYDMFSAFFVASVPVYLGAPDVTDYVPRDCFVDYRDFSTLDALVARVQEIADSDEWEEYRERGWAFVNSPAFEPFTMKHFCETVYTALADTAS